jgi:hypothetical protein
MWLGFSGAALLVASLVYVVPQLLTEPKGLSAADTAGLLGLPVGVAALVVSVLAGRQAPEGGLADLARGWAATLATQVKETEERQWRQLLGDDTQRINLAFTVRMAPARTATVPADAGRLFDGTSTIPDVVTYYRQTHPRRLVVTGAAGAGKTVLALELMLALLEERGSDDPVPVRLSMAEWDTTVLLRDLLVHQLVDVYDWPATMAAELVRQNRVLPVLDGLDEMDPTQPDGMPSADATRALAALRALNAYQEGRSAGPLILTCRTTHYDALTSRTRLLDAARIDINPVPAPDARTYLLQRADDPTRWEPLLEALRDDPAGLLATTLSTPWRLCLAATVYARDGTPADLLRHSTPDELDEHLLARFIPAATALFPNRYDAARTHRWLARLAAHLNAPNPGPGLNSPADSRPGTDLVLHQLWPLAGRCRVRVADALLTAFAVLLPPLLLTLLLLAVLPEEQTAPLLLSPQQADLAVPVSVALVSVFAGLGAARSRQRAPRHMQWPLLWTRDGLRRFAARMRRGVLTGVLWGLAGGCALDLLAWSWEALPEEQYIKMIGFGDSLVLPGWLGLPLILLGLGVLSGFAGGILGGLVDGASGEPSTANQPRRIIRGTLPHGTLAGLASGFTGGLVGFLLASLMMSVDADASGDGAGSDIPLGSVLRLFLTGEWADVSTALGGAHPKINGLYINEGLQFTSGLVLGLTAALAAGLIRIGLIRRYLVFLACARGKLPWRLGAFLDWCCSAGMMRLSGTAYQFRHRELQQWLGDRPSLADCRADQTGMPTQ